MTNPYGDVELAPKGMRALAHPVRLAILGELQRHGPNTATALAPVVGASPSVTSWHLRHLAQHGLVRDAETGNDGRQRWWEAVARGFRMKMPADEAGQEAYRMLSGAMFSQSERLPQEWAATVEPRLDVDWRRRAGMSNTRILATADEVDAIEAAIEELLAPYVLRKDDTAPPPDARHVRILRYTLPELS
jgi:DNA-binding transcriptional ArsR family regulator